MIKWPYTDRQSYEAALRRATLELLKASNTAILNGDEASSEDLNQVIQEIHRMRQDSIETAAAGRPKLRRVTDGQIAGQTRIRHGADSK